MDHFRYRYYIANVVNVNDITSSLSMCPRSNYDNPLFVIASDDQAWCQRHLTGPDVTYTRKPESSPDQLEAIGLYDKFKTNNTQTMHKTYPNTHKQYTYKHKQYANIPTHIHKQTQTHTSTCTHTQTIHRCLCMFVHFTSSV